VWEAATICPRPLQVDLLTFKVVSESRVTWATSVPICLPRPLCSRLRPDVRDRQTSVAHDRLMPLWGRGIIRVISVMPTTSQWVISTIKAINRHQQMFGQLGGHRSTTTEATLFRRGTLYGPTSATWSTIVMPPPLIGGGIKRWCASDVCLSRTSGLSREQRRRKTKIGTEVAHVTRESDNTFKVKRSRSPGRFTHRRVSASGSCSGGRVNVLAVRNFCYVAVCSAARGASAPTEGGEAERGRGISRRPPADSLLPLPMMLRFCLCQSLSRIKRCRGNLLEWCDVWLATHD